MDFVKTQISEGVLTVTLNRPDKLNALTQEMYAALSSVFSQLNNNHEVRAVILYGGENFTAGNDLNDFLENPPEDPEAHVFQFMRAVIRLEVPLIAVVSGAAIGIGTTILPFCDLVLVTKKSKLGVPFVKLGLSPEFGSTLTFPTIFGNARAAQLLLCGDFFSGEEAVAWGMANAAYDTVGECMHAALKRAADFASANQGALRASKRMVRAPLVDKLKDALYSEIEEFIDRLKLPEAQAALRSMVRA